NAIYTNPFTLVNLPPGKNRIKKPYTGKNLKALVAPPIPFSSLRDNPTQVVAVPPRLPAVSIRIGAQAIVIYLAGVKD
ncbi:hypothetical protein ACRALDRAFT_1062226, partial [Sodiomyces alcalophilus JCM 7366]|uniref:uncharacterized protein n=1 Tax=Sodiomyces alcalophilus JCM 7366 TaxID=591952 RepID=UPI0039B48113